MDKENIRNKEVKEVFEKKINQIESTIRELKLRLDSPDISEEEAQIFKSKLKDEQTMLIVAKKRYISIFKDRIYD